MVASKGTTSTAKTSDPVTMSLRWGPRRRRGGGMMAVFATIIIVFIVVIVGLIQRIYAYRLQNRIGELDRLHGSRRSNDGGQAHSLASRRSRGLLRAAPWSALR